MKIYNTSGVQASSSKLLSDENTIANTSGPPLISAYDVIQPQADDEQTLPSEMIEMIDVVVKNAGHQMGSIPEAQFVEVAEAAAEDIREHVAEHGVPISSRFADHVIDLSHGTDINHNISDLYPDEAITADAPEHDPIRNGLKKFVCTVFQPFRTTANAQDMDNLIKDLVDWMRKDGFDLAQLLKCVEKIETFDRVLGYFHGAMQGAAPFAIMGLFTDTVLAELMLGEEPTLWDLMGYSATAGALLGTVDVVAGNAMQRAFNRCYYTKAPPVQHQTAMMEEWLAARPVFAPEQTKDLMMSLVPPYCVRNAFRLTVDSTLVATLGNEGKAIVPLVNLGVDSVGGLFAGSYMRDKLNACDRKHGHMDLAYLFANPKCREWVNEVNKGINEGISLRRTLNAGVGVLNCVKSVVEDIPTGFRNIFTRPAVAEISVLTVGLAGTVTAQTAAGAAVEQWAAGAAARLFPTPMAANFALTAAEITTRGVSAAGLALTYAALVLGLTRTQPR